MSRLVFDENFKVFAGLLADAPVDPLNPTIAEVEDLTNITAFVPKDGFSSGVSNTRVDGGDLSTKFTAESMGTWSSQLAIRAFLDGVSANDLAWELWGENEFTHFTVVVVPFGLLVPDARAYVWADIENGVAVPMDPAGNERQKFLSEFACHVRPYFNAALSLPS